MKRRARGWISRHFDHKLLKNQERKMIDLLQLFLTHLQGYKRQAVWSPHPHRGGGHLSCCCPWSWQRSWIRPSQPATRLTFSAGCGDAGAGGRAMLCGVLAAKYSAFASQGFSQSAPVPLRQGAGVLLCGH